MKTFRTINVNTNECVVSGNLAFILEDFKARNYPCELKVVDEEDKIVVPANQPYENIVKWIKELTIALCKRCPKCGRLLPKEHFCKKTSAVDGLQAECKECQAKYNKQRYEMRKAERESRAIDSGEVIKTGDSTKLHKVYSNPDLARFTPRELMAELKARGFRWEWMLEPQKKIMFDKI